MAQNRSTFQRDQTQQTVVAKKKEISLQGLLIL